MATTAYAGANLKQQDDGGNAAWVNHNGVEFPVGDPGHVVHVTDLSTASTAYVVAHKAGLLTKVYAVLNGAFDAASNTSTLTVFLASAASADNQQFTQVTDTGGSTLAFASTDHGGTNDSVTFNDGNNTQVVSQGDVIAIVTDGGSTGTISGTITIVIE